MRFSDPGVIFPHYDFSNPSLDPANGFIAGGMLVLDGSDFNSGISNSWLARFQVSTGAFVPDSTNVPVPTLSYFGLLILALMVLGVGIVGFRRFG